MSPDLCCLGKPTYTICTVGISVSSILGALGQLLTLTYKILTMLLRWAVLSHLSNPSNIHITYLSEKGKEGEGRVRENGARGAQDPRACAVPRQAGARISDRGAPRTIEPRPAQRQQRNMPPDFFARRPPDSASTVGVSRDEGIDAMR